MSGPGFRTLCDMALVLETEFCRACELKRCLAESPADPECLFASEWASIYDDLDQLLSRASMRRGGDA